MSHLSDMVRDALERERARIQSDDEERREDLERLRTTMASALPDEVWSELGVDPKSAVLTRAQSGHERLTTEASVNLEGEEIEVSAVMAADSSRRRVAKPLLVALYAAGRKVELPSVAEGDDAASIPGENARSVGRLLLAALRNRREERREEYRAKLYEIQTRIEGACESGRLVTCEEWITGVRDEDKERLVSLARSRTEELKNKEDEERRRAEADKLEKIAAVAEARKLHEEHGAEWERYEKEARKWAEEQTFHLFRPWKGRRIRYAPDFSGEGTIRIQASSCDEEDFVDIRAELVHEAFVVGEADEEGFYTVVDVAGHTTRKRFGAILDEEVVSFDSLPPIEEKRFHHRSFGAEPYIVNLPPTTEGEPSPPPEAPKTWHGRMENLDLSRLNYPLEDHIRYGQVDLSKHTPEEIAQGSYERNPGYYDTGDLPLLTYRRWPPANAGSHRPTALDLAESRRAHTIPKKPGRKGQDSWATTPASLWTSPRSPTEESFRRNSGPR